MNSGNHDGATDGMLKQHEHDLGGCDDSRFDQAMRELHSRALTTVSADTHASLRKARTAVAAAGRLPSRGAGWLGVNTAGANWALAGGVATVFALAIGLQFSGVMFDAAPADAIAEPARTAAVNGTTATGRPIDGDRGTIVFATLDENPDFYLWLASNDDTLPAAWER